VNRSGLTLLETMVALVILGVVVVGYLELFAATARSTEDLDLWSSAVAYAENAVESVKLDPSFAIANSRQSLPGGFERRVDLRPWGAGLQLASITVQLPDGRTFALSRLLEIP
jgi:prepilin-type N-terminal cleavage/methylation domain-containing protein